MKANLKRAVSFALSLVLCFACNVGYVAAETANSTTGVQERPNTGIASITEIQMVDIGSGLYDLIVTGKAIEASGAEIIMTLRNNSNGVAGSNDAEVFSGAEFTRTIYGITLPDGIYFVALSDLEFMANPSELPQKGYKVVFQVKNNEIVVEDPTNPPWKDKHDDYEMTATLQWEGDLNYVYGQEVSPETVTLRNTGWNSLTDVGVTVSGVGLTVSPIEDIVALASGATQEYLVTADTAVTPGSYSVSLELSATGDGTSNPAISVPIVFELARATQPAIEGIDVKAATVKGGLGKITGLTPSAVYDLAPAEPDKADDALTWTTFTAIDGVLEVTPGSYKLRLPETKFYEAGETDGTVTVPDFYHFEDAVITDMKAGVDTNYAVCDLVNGGIGTKTFTIKAGNLPGGLTLSGDGYITGSATVVTTGSFVLQVEVTDENPVTAESVQTGTITIAGIAKGDQATPAALNVAAEDVSLLIENWQASQEYAATTDAAITVGGLAWKSWPEGETGAGILTGLSPNKQYLVYTRAMKTDLLNPSPVTTSSATTLRSTVAAITISGSGILGENLEAVVSPAAATVEYNWKYVGGNTVGTGAALEVTSGLIGKEIELIITGTGDYQGDLTSQSYLVGGCNVSVTVNSYNPNTEVTAVLTSTDGALTFAAISTTSTGIGRVVQTVTFSAVNPNQTYNLVLSKAGHTDVMIGNIALRNDDMSITTAGGLSELRMYCGDFNGDNAVRLEDRGTLLQSKYYGKTVKDFAGDEAAIAAMLDIDGDGYIRFNDLAILMSSENYGKDAVSVQH